MKRLIYLFSAVTVLSMILSACAAVAGPDATQAPAVTEPPIATDAPTEAPTAVPIDLAGPLMELGHFYTYFDGSILAPVPAGPFLMGLKLFSDSKEYEVTLSDYWIYTNEVTNQQYALCVSTGKCSPPDKKDNPTFDNYRFVNFPVVGVTYQQAADYCGFAQGRLPTEAEWEKAARGPDSNIFPWGNAAPVCNLLNFDFCKGKALKVESYPEGVSFYGLFDMSGNVAEWAADWYKPEYDVSASIDPLGPALGEKRSIRSSSFEDGGDSAYSAHRYSLKPAEHLPTLGFRCVVEDPAFYAPYCQGMVLYGADINGAPNVPVVPDTPNCVQQGLSTTQDGCGSGTSHVTFDPWPPPDGVPLPDVPAATGCNGDRPTATCTGTGTVTWDPMVCEAAPPPSVDPSCSPGYASEPDPVDSSKIICKGQGPGVNCPDGFALDPLLNCCSAVNPGPNQYGFCIGFDQASSMECYNNPDEPIQPHQVQVNVATPNGCDCTGPGCDTCDPLDTVTNPNGCGDDDDTTCTNPAGCGPPACTANSCSPWPTCCP